MCTFAGILCPFGVYTHTQCDLIDFVILFISSSSSSLFGLRLLFLSLSISHFWTQRTRIGFYLACEEILSFVVVYSYCVCLWWPLTIFGGYLRSLCQQVCVCVLHLQKKIFHFGICHAQNHILYIWCDFCRWCDFMVTAVVAPPQQQQYSSSFI